MAKFMKVFNHGNEQIDLSGIGVTSKECVPTELHHKNNGSVDEKPSFVIVMKMPSGLSVYGQLSLETLSECLNELGYNIT